MVIKGILDPEDARDAVRFGDTRHIKSFALFSLT